METYFIIYKTTCLITNKFYVGMHKTTNLQDGYLGSGKILKRSLKKHGVKNHVFEILEYLPDFDSLVKREREIVNETLISDPSCMNLKIGGEGGFTNVEHQRKAQFAGGKAFWKMYPEKSLSNLQKGFKKDMDVEEKDKLIKKSKDTSSKKGKTWSFSGKHHTDEHREKMRKIMSESQKGEKHAQYGTCWITKDFENKKVKKEDLPLWLENGWIKGRKMNKVL